MALRFLLRRVANPALLLTPGPRMGPVHGVSPAVAARFMETGSQGEAKTVAEQESMRSRQRFIDEQNKAGKDFAQLEKAARQRLDEYSKAIDDLRKVGNVSAVVIAAIPLVMIIGHNYLA